MRRAMIIRLTFPAQKGSSPVSISKSISVLVKHFLAAQVGTPCQVLSQLFGGVGAGDIE